MAVPTTPTLIGMYDSPAVQLIVNNESTTVTYHTPKLDIDALINWDVASGSGTAAQNSAETLDHLAADPGKYLTMGSAYAPIPVSGYSQGTAWGVSSNGYLVTNHHVVDYIADSYWTSWTLTNTLVNRTVQDLVKQYTSGITFGPNYDTFPVTQAQYDALTTAVTNFMEGTAGIDTPSRVLNVGGGQSVNTQDLGDTAQIVATSPKEYPDADVAIVKIDAVDLPVVPLGDDTTLSSGDNVYALGYPGAASFESGASQNAVVTATQSSGQVTNRLTQSDGTSEIENSAPINHGNSGGPLVDSNGRVVGIVTAVDGSDGSDASNGAKFFFATPISAVKKVMAQAGVTQLIAPDQATYDKAMDLMQASHYKAAQADLNIVQTNGFSSPYIMMHAAMVAKAIANGEDKPLPSGDSKQLVMAGGTVLLVVLGGGIFVVRRRSRKGTASGPALTPQSSPAYNPPSFT